MKISVLVIICMVCLSISLKSEEKLSPDIEFSGVIKSYKLLLHEKIKLPDFVLTFDEPQIAITSGSLRGDDQMANFNYKNLSIYYFNGRYYYSGQRFMTEGKSLFYNKGSLLSEGKVIKKLKHDDIDIKNLGGRSTGATKEFVRERNWSNLTFKYKTQGMSISLNYTPIIEGEFHYSLFWLSGEIKEGHLYIFNKKITKIEKESFFDFSSDKLFVDKKFIGKISELIK